VPLSGLLHVAVTLRHLPWAPVPTPHAAARPVICHGPWFYRLLMLLLPGPECVMGYLYGLPLLLSPSPHSAMCHFHVSSHCWWVPFCHRVLYGLSIAAAPPPHVAPHSGYAP
ncbi:unnamed protein product, partial [Staurois parvus]